MSFRVFFASYQECNSVNSHKISNIQSPNMHIHPNTLNNAKILEKNVYQLYQSIN